MTKIFFKNEKGKNEVYVDSRGASEILGYSYDYFRRLNLENVQQKKVGNSKLYRLEDLENLKKSEK